MQKQIAPDGEVEKNNKANGTQRNKDIAADGTTKVQDTPTGEKPTIDATPKAIEKTPGENPATTDYKIAMESNVVKALEKAMNTAFAVPLAI